MELVEDPSALAATLAPFRRHGEAISLIPTMGNLHDGHRLLVQMAAGTAPRRVVSLFVNPLQFGPDEDLDEYPRTFERDRATLEAAGADVLFAPTVESLYPAGAEAATRVEVPGLSRILCGATRAVHFSGVATVVSKLFNLVQPQVAVFGEKDYQQLVIVRRMTADLHFPVRIVGVPTVREADGLAMSSRNQYLTDVERRRAPALYQALTAAVQGLREGIAAHETLEKEGLGRLRRAGMQPEYFVIRNAHDLSEPAAADRDLVILAAARLGKARLIDNLRVSLPNPAG